MEGQYVGVSRELREANQEVERLKQRVASASKDAQAELAALSDKVSALNSERESLQREMKRLQVFFLETPPSCV